MKFRDLDTVLLSLTINFVMKLKISMMRLISDTAEIKLKEMVQNV